MRISDWSSDVCSSDLVVRDRLWPQGARDRRTRPARHWWRAPGAAGRRPAGGQTRLRTDCRRTRVDLVEHRAVRGQLNRRAVAATLAKGKDAVGLGGGGDKSDALGVGRKWDRTGKAR